MGQTGAQSVTLCPGQAQVSGGMLAICGYFGERTETRLTSVGATVARAASTPTAPRDRPTTMLQLASKMLQVASKTRTGTRSMTSCRPKARRSPLLFGELQQCGDVVSGGATSFHRSANRAVRTDFGPVARRVALVHEVDRQAARPVESLLSSLVARDLVSAKEVTGTCDEIEAALEAHRPRALEVAPGQIARRVPREGTSVSSEEVAR